MSVISPGTRVGRLTVIEMVTGGNANTRKYRCVCDCGGEKITSEDNLRRGHTRSCGCLRYGHGGSKKKNIFLGSDSKLYRTWDGIKSRCFNQNNHNYHNYGGRGITMCNEWKNDYNTFKQWALENGYDETGGRNCSIERININGNYGPDNCKWATAKEQGNNRRTNTIIVYNGVKYTLSQLADKAGLNYSTFISRYSRGWDINKIMNCPVRRYGRVMKCLL